VAGKPCSNLAAVFGSFWVPVCGDTPGLARIYLVSAQISTVLPLAPAESEGRITASPDSVWMVTDQMGTLVRIDPATNTVRQKIQLPAGSYNPLFADGLIWV